MSYIIFMERTIIWTHEAIRQLMALPARIADVIVARIEEMGVNPAASANRVKMLKGSRLLRLRVGDYRVIFTDEGLVLTILRVGNRKDIYE